MQSDFDRDVPLVDEVQDLLLKERTLMTLKVLEQQKEANEWKERYEMLVHKVTDVVPQMNNVNAFEIVADIENYNQATWQSGVDEIPHILRDLSDFSFLDLSEKPLGQKGVKQILKALHSLKNKKITTVLLSNCNIEDNCCEEIHAILGMNNIEAMDLSNNELGANFEEGLITTLKIRKHHPQYLLLHGNMALSKSFRIGSLIGTNIVSERTWGISVSLQDFLETSYSRIEKQKKNEINNKQPLLCAKFLMLLEASLSPLEPSSTSTSTSTSKDKKPKSNNVNPYMDYISGKESEKRRLKSLSTLGLTSAHLGQQSIQTLEMLSRVISSPKGCQLVRLGLQGNACGNIGMSTLSDAIKVNNTLTSLDLRSNDIGASGLRTFANNLCLCGISGSVSLSMSPSVLVRLDIRNNNDISPRDGHWLQNTLRNHGCDTVVLWSTDADRDSLLSDSVGRKLKQDTDSEPDRDISVWYRDKRKTRVNLISKVDTGRGGSVTDGTTEGLLFAVSRGQLFQNIGGAGIESEMGNKELGHSESKWVLEWRMRPSPTPIPSPSSNPMATETPARIKGRIGWELRAVREEEDDTRSVREIAGGTLTSSVGNVLLSGIATQAQKDLTWTKCKVEVPVDAVPTLFSPTIRLELWCWSWREVAVDAMDFQLSSVRGKGSLALMTVGGDRRDWSETVNAFASAGTLRHFGSVPEVDSSHSVLRSISVPATTRGCRYQLSWEMCLGSSTMVSSASNWRGGTIHPGPHGVEVTGEFGYEWEVRMCDPDGGPNMVCEQSRWPSLQSHNSDDNDNDSGRTLAAWTWRRWEVMLPHSASGYTLVISAAAVVSGGSNTSDVLSDACVVRLRNCMLSEPHVVDSNRDYSAWMLPHSRRGAELFCNHDDQDITILF
eukprot:gene4442-8853_t